MDNTFLTVAEVAELLKLNQQTVRNWIDAGDLPAIRVGRRVRIRQSELERFINAGETARQARDPESSAISADSTDEAAGEARSGNQTGDRGESDAEAAPIPTALATGTEAANLGVILRSGEHLMGPAEVGERLGITPQALSTQKPPAGLPEPVQNLRGTRVWLREEIEAFARERDARRRTSPETPQ